MKALWLQDGAVDPRAARQILRRYGSLHLSGLFAA